LHGVVFVGDVDRKDVDTPSPVRCVIATIITSHCAIFCNHWFILSPCIDSSGLPTLYIIFQLSTRNDARNEHFLILLSTGRVLLFLILRKN